MTIQELYGKIGGSYDSALKILQSERLVSKFILRFLTDTSAQRLLDAYAAKDSTGMFEGAHALKGVCANLGLDELSRRASEIAEEYRPGNQPKLRAEELDQRMQELAELYEQSVAGIQEFAAQQ